MEIEGLKRLLDRPRATGATDWATMRDRYRGVILGVAAGNALGLGLEGWTRRMIEGRFPNGVREVDVAERSRPWDDDLAQTALLAEALLAGGDTDTNGAVAGAVMGSRVGHSGVPRRWVERIRETGRLLDLADRLLQACERPR
ncbi:MAG: ADP-ribosylglycohydrolase family protein [Nitrospinota bacterium]